jgi:ankyrin repeat protein
MNTFNVKNILKAAFGLTLALSLVEGAQCALAPKFDKPIASEQGADPVADELGQQLFDLVDKFEKSPDGKYLPSKIDDVRELIAAGANVNVVHGSLTPLTYAATKGAFYKCSEYARVLINAGAKVNLQGFGETALIWAAHYGDLEMCMLLIGAHADVSLRNMYGQTALQRALKWGNNDVALFLLAASGNDCPICTERIGEDTGCTILPCGHFFCTACINQWLPRNNSCPTCRGAVAKRIDIPAEHVGKDEEKKDL